MIDSRLPRATCAKLLYIPWKSSAWDAARSLLLEVVFSWKSRMFLSRAALFIDRSFMFEFSIRRNTMRWPSYASAFLPKIIWEEKWWWVFSSFSSLCLSFLSEDGKRELSFFSRPLSLGCAMTSSARLTLSASFARKCHCILLGRTRENVNQLVLLPAGLVGWQAIRGGKTDGRQDSQNKEKEKNWTLCLVERNLMKARETDSIEVNLDKSVDGSFISFSTRTRRHPQTRKHAHKHL